MNKILVPYDFSDVALHALNFAADLARKVKEHCTVNLINVIEHPTPDTIKTMGIVDYDPMEAVYIKQMMITMEEKMKALMADAKYKDIDLNYKIVLGQPFHEITNEITTTGVELVVMGTSGVSGAEEFLVGSNAERMVRYSKCPVITLSEESNVSSVQDIVFASNFYEVPASFVEHIKRLQAAFDAELKIVKINTPASFTTTRHDMKQMSNFVEKFDLKNYSLDIYNHTNEEDGIVAYAEDMGADLIALGTNQRRGVGHFINGSIAEDVVNHSKIPVWTFGLDAE
ncbi:universal stress protein [Marinoscillum sp. MHG1-6]|uniref:universal stress protein n=1 Tax=Marinoscillum sp. MHG1-6 TaxID=2959627 RepID=UPI002157A8CD|nr:universal stress protein [Marinoscillum sp. MHG1-6]